MRILTTVNERRNDIDWLRIFAVYLLFIYHTAKIFDATPFMHLKNNPGSAAMGVFTWSIKLWHMPLFFLLAGWAISGSLQKRGAAGFAKERVLRLLIPFVAGCMLLCPIMVFTELRAKGEPIVFLEFLPRFYTSMHYFSWSHLWFLIYLMTFTLIYFPLFCLLQKKTGGARCSTLFVYLPVIPLAIIQMTLRERWPGFQNLYDDWANFLYFSSFVIIGYMLAKFPVLERRVHRQWPITLTIGLAAVFLSGTINIGTWSKAGWTVTAFAGYFTVIGLLGFARAFLSFNNNCLPYLRESAYPVYIIHQPCIVIPGFFIIGMRTGMAVKYSLILVCAVIFAMTAYHFALRRLTLARFLLGMKPQASKAPKVSESPKPQTI